VEHGREKIRLARPSLAPGAARRLARRPFLLRHLAEVLEAPDTVETLLDGALRLSKVCEHRLVRVKMRADLVVAVEQDIA